jgi:2-phosphoglycerate kinase
MDPGQTRSQSAPTDLLVKDKTEALAETNEEVISKKISKYDVLKVRVWLEDHFFIFSRFLVSRILTLNKVPPKDSIRIAMDLKKLLVEEEKFEVKQSEMENYLFQIMRAYNYGESFVRRYQMVSSFYAQRAPLLILVAGPPVCGKSTLVTQLADRVNVANVLQTSIVTSVMKNILNDRNTKPFWGYSESEQSGILNYESQVVRKGVHTDILKCLQEGKSLIIEGYELDPMLYLHHHEDAPRKFRITLLDSEDLEARKLKKQLDDMDQANAVIVPFLLTISEKEHAYIIENWLMSVLPSDIQNEVQALGKFQKQLKHLLKCFQRVQQNLLEYNDILTVIPINTQHIDETLNTMHNVILARIEASFINKH